MIIKWVLIKKIVVILNYNYFYYILFLIISSISLATAEFSFKKFLTFSLHCPIFVSQ